MTKLTDEAKAENEQAAKKQKYERDAVKNSDVVGEINPSQKLQSDRPDPSDETRDENDPRKNPEAPASDLRKQ